MKKHLRFISFVVIVSAAISTFAQPGILDNTFGTAGKVFTDFGGSNDDANAMTIQADGKIILAGSTYNGNNYDFALIRYNTNGSIDNSFGTSGKVITPFGNSDDFARAISLQAFGKIIVAGYTVSGNKKEFAVARYNNDGSLDNSFNSSGKATLSFGTRDDIGTSVVVQTDGSIIVGGYTYKDSINIDFALACFNTSGTLDNSFGTSGKVITDLGSNNDYGLSMALQTGGKILLGGYSGDSADFNFAIARYNANGVIDTTFAGKGKNIIKVSAYYDYGKAISVQADQKILMTGWSFNGSNYDLSVVRCNPDGDIDGNFGGGKVITEVGNSYDYGMAVTSQIDNKVLVAGYAMIGSSYNFMLVRYNANGSLDPSFSDDGLVVTSIATSDSRGYAIAVQPDYKILVAGRTFNGSNRDFALARYITETNPNIISYIPNINSLKIFPNPLTDGASINFSIVEPDKVSIALYDYTGKLIKTILSEHSFSGGIYNEQINMGNYDSGIYFLFLKGNFNSYIEKIVKK